MISTLLFFTLLSFSQHSLELPTAAKEALDNEFPKWKLLEYSKKFYGDQPVDRRSRPFLKCQLNHDTIPDYVLGIVTKKETTLTVHFVALVSKQDSFSVFTLAAYVNPDPDQKPLTVVLHLYPKNVPVSNFGFRDEQNVPVNLLQRWDQNEMISTFDTDCPSLLVTDKNGCHTFVFAEERFWAFEACD